MISSPMATANNVRPEGKGQNRLPPQIKQPHAEDNQNWMLVKTQSMNLELPQPVSKSQVMR